MSSFHTFRLTSCFAHPRRQECRVWKSLEACLFACERWCGSVLRLWTLDLMIWSFRILVLVSFVQAFG